MAYPYMKPEVIDVLNKNQKDIRFLLDSGAFTAWKAGKSINLDDYCRFIESLPFKPWRYFTLDVIGDPNKSLKNYETMLSRGFKPIPIFTRGEDVKIIDHYYKTSDVVGIGGLVGTQGNKGFVKGIMDVVGKRKCHWLGFVAENFIKHYRPYSCDSSNITLAGRYGFINLWDRQKKVFKKIAKKDFFKQPTRDTCSLLESYGVSAVHLKNKNAWHASNGQISMSEELSFASHVTANIDYEKNIGTHCFIALARLPLDLRVSLKYYKKETSK